MKRALLLVLVCLGAYAQVPLPSPVNVGSGGGGGTIPSTTQLLKGDGAGNASATNLTGDITTSGAQTTTLATVNSNVGTCGDAAHVGQVTLNGKGLATACTAVAITAGTGNAATNVTTTFSATPTFTASSNTATQFTITLTGNVTSCTIASATAGQLLNLNIVQDGSGGHTFACSGFTGLATISTTASISCQQAFVADSSSAAHSTGPMVCPTSDSLSLIPGSGGTTATFPAGAVTMVDTTTAQSLAAKTLTAPILGNYTVATLPSTATGKMAYVTDGASATDCTTGSGSTKVLCMYTGAAWAAPNGGGGSSLTASSYPEAPWGGLNGGSGVTMSANTVYYYPITVGPQGRVVNAVVQWFLTSSGIGGADTNNVSASLYDATCTKVANGQSATVQITGSNQIAVYTFTSASIAQATSSGYGFVGISSDGAPTQFGGQNNGANGNLITILNAGLSSSTYVVFTGSNAASGTTTHTQPSTCGSTRTPISSGGQELPAITYR